MTKVKEKPGRKRASLKVRLGKWQEWISLILLLLTLGISVRSIEGSFWISPQPELTLVLCLSMLTCLVMFRSNLPVAVTLPLNLFIFAVVLIWQTLSVMPLWATWGTNSIISSIRSLWQTISSGKPSENTIFFALFIVICVWVIGYISTWYVLHRKNAWIAAFLGAAAILVNLYNLSEESYSYFIYYLLAAMMLIAFVNLTSRHIFFERLRAKYPKRVFASFIASALCLSLIITGISWLAPEIRASELETIVSTRMPKSKDIESYWMNLFAAVSSKTTLIRSSHQQQLTFNAPLNLSQDIQFAITSTVNPSYWRMRRFDIYNAWGWSSSPTSEQMLSSSTPVNVSAPSADQSELSYTVVHKIKTDVMLTAGELVSANIHTIYLSLLPAGSGKESQSNNPSTAQTQGAGNMVAMTSARLLKPNDSYQATTSISSVTPAKLSKAGQNYPGSVTDFYLQLPSSFPLRLRQVSQLITRRAQAQTAYDKAMAIKSYLSGFTYTETGTAPPEGVDGVDYFLSTAKSGNCTNFASAMVVMLRSVGVPARFATGYLTREWNENTKTATIRAKDYHAWPEVYFPGPGWIEFEATPLPDQSNPGGVGVDDSAEDVSEETSAASDSAQSELSWIQLSLIILGIMLLLFILVSIVHRRFRYITSAQYASEMYARMCFYASLLRLRPSLSQTPLEYSRELAAVFTSQAEPIGNIAQAYIKTTFSQNKKLNAREMIALNHSWHILFRAFLKRMVRFGH